MMNVEFPFLRHCERIEAIQSREEELDCFVARVPRNDAPPKGISA
jgi:hypothetical protein